MSIDPLLFFDLVAGVILLSAGFAAVVILYARTNHRLQAAIEDEKRMEKHLSKKATELLEDAQKKSVKILEKAQVKALELVNSSGFYNDSTRHVFEKELKAAQESQSQEFGQVSQEFLSSYQSALDELKSEDIKKFQSISKDIESDAQSQVQDFARIIEEETISAQKIVEEKIEEEYQKVKTELDEYKNTQYGKIDENIYGIIRKVSEKIIGKAMPLEDSEQLVAQALEEAKKDVII